MWLIQSCIRPFSVFASSHVCDALRNFAFPQWRTCPYLETQSSQVLLVFRNLKKFMKAPSLFSAREKERYIYIYIYIERERERACGLRPMYFSYPLRRVTPGNRTSLVAAVFAFSDVATIPRAISSFALLFNGWRVTQPAPASSCPR